MKRTSLAKPLTFSLALAATSALAAGQGADDCAMATPINGPGPHAFDNTTATQSGVVPSCVNLTNDVWFAWTAGATGPYIFTTCGQATNDTAAAIYDGTCAGSEIGCNDDACGLQTRITFNAVAGQVYIVQVGSFSAASVGAGTFTIQLDAPILNPGNGHYYRVVNGLLSWQDASAAAQASMWQGRPGHLATITSQVELDWILQNIAPSRPWIGLFQNTSSPSYSEPGGGWEWVTGEPTSFVNWAVGEPNDTSGTGGPEDYCEMFGSGEWNDCELNHVFTNQYLIEYSNTNVGSNYCMANVNSTGMTGLITGTGSASIASNNFSIGASRLPMNAFGFFLTSRTQGFTANPGGSQGNLCLAGSIGRYQLLIQNTGASGTLMIPVNLTAMPTPGGLVAAQVGETWNFQAWHRDLVAGTITSNFTNGLQVTFQ